MAVVVGDLVLDPFVSVLDCDLHDRATVFLRVLKSHFGMPQRTSKDTCGVFNHSLLFCIPGSSLLSSFSTRIRNVCSSAKAYYYRSLFVTLSRPALLAIMLR